MFYDALLVLALLLCAEALLLWLNHGRSPATHFFHTLYLLAVIFGFYGWFWTHGGQTLGLKAWKIKVLTLEKRPLNWKQSAIRFVAALLSWAIGGLGFFWILWDKNGYAWHDYLSKTCLFFETEANT